MVTLKEIEDEIEAHQKEHKCRVVQSRIEKGKIKEMKCVPFDTYENYVISVWNCYPTLMQEKKTEMAMWQEPVKVPEEKQNVVTEAILNAFSEADYYINCSGIYPVSQKLAKKLKELSIIE